MSDFTVRYTHRSGLVRYHTVDSKIDLHALVDVLLDNGYTELKITATHETEEATA